MNYFNCITGESSNYTTMYLEEHNVLRSPRSGLCVYDTRGLDEDRVDEGLEEVSTFISDGVRHNQACYRSSDDHDQRVKGSSMENISKSRYMKRKVNCVMVVADLSQIHNAFKCGGDLKSMEALKALFHLSAIKNSSKSSFILILYDVLLFNLIRKSYMSIFCILF